MVSTSIRAAARAGGGTAAAGEGEGHGGDRQMMDKGINVV